MSLENISMPGWDQLWPHLKGIGDLDRRHRVCMINLASEGSEFTSMPLPIEFKEVHLFSFLPTATHGSHRKHHLPDFLSINFRQQQISLSRHSVDRAIIFAEELSSIASSLRLIPEIRRILTPDGRVVIAVPSDSSRKDDIAEFQGYRNYLSKHLKDNGFSNIIVGKFPPFNLRQKVKFKSNISGLVIATATRARSYPFPMYHPHRETARLNAISG